MKLTNQIFLSPPHMTGHEQKYLQEAFESNYIAPVGHNIQLFEQKIEDFIGQNKKVVALNSGTSAIHLALQMLGIQKDDYVICPTFTFVATANPILYCGAQPIFVDSEEETWNICPKLLLQAIKNSPEKPKAIIVVDIYGMPAQIDEIKAISKAYEIPIIEDSAEALGSFYKNQACGTFGDFSIFSFNGNKIITTSSGGALVCNNNEKEKCIFLATQAKESVPFYEHHQLGYNYRLSNVLASIGCGQMDVLQNFIELRKQNFLDYNEGLKDLVEFQNPDHEDFNSNYWLTSILFKNDSSREVVENELLKNNIEVRRLWNPLHKQKLFLGSLVYENGVSEKLFQNGLSLPSGSALTKEDKNRIIEIIHKTI